MLARRVIPVLLCRGRSLIKGRRFQSWRTVGVAAQAVLIYQSRGVDELMLLDIGATPENRGVDLALIKELSEVCFMPLTVGGGVKTIEDANGLLRAGADKIAVGAGGVKVIREISDNLGCQAVVGIIDYIAKGDAAIKCVVDRAKQLEDAGAGEILLQCIEREGEMEGFDLQTIKAVSDSVGVPVIASCGCGSYEDMHKAFEVGADAVGVGSMFQFADLTPKGAAKYLSERGVEVRI